jgi:hypothetical protein
MLSPLQLKQGRYTSLNFLAIDRCIGAGMLDPDRSGGRAITTGPKQSGRILKIGMHKAGHIGIACAGWVVRIGCICRDTIALLAIIEQRPGLGERDNRNRAA